MIKCFRPLYFNLHKEKALNGCLMLDVEVEYYLRGL